MATLPWELIYGIIDTFVWEASRHQLGMDGTYLRRPIEGSLLPCRLVSRAICGYLTPVVFRHVQCSSRARVRLFHKIMNANPTLALHVRELYIEQNAKSSCWLHNEPFLPLVLRTLSGHHLEGLSIEVDGMPRIPWNAFHQDFKAALHQIVGSEDNLERLRLVNLEVPLSLLDRLGNKIRFLELCGVTTVRIKPSKYSNSTTIVAATRTLPLQVETISLWASTSALDRLTRLVGMNDPGANTISLPRLTRVVLDQMFLVLDRSGMELLMGNAPKLEHLRLTAHKGHIERFLDINDLSVKGGIRYLELVTIVMDKSTFPDYAITSYLSKISSSSKIETITVIVKVPRTPKLQLKRVRQQAAKTVGEGDLSQLLLVLETALYSQLRRVIFDLSNLRLDHSIALLLEGSVLDRLSDRLSRCPFCLEFRF